MDSRNGTPGADGFPEAWVEAARATYHPPGEPPREEMWREIEARLFAPPLARRGIPTTPWFRLLAAASVALLLGLGLGRWSSRSHPVDAAVERPTLAGPAAPEGGVRSSASVRFAAARHFDDVEALLDFVAADARQGRVDADVSRWGSGLLTQTRLLLDSPVAGDPAVRGVLEDLELVLAQIALLGHPAFDSDRVRSELELIDEGVRRGGVRERIHSVLPSMVPRLVAAEDD